MFTVAVYCGCVVGNRWRCHAEEPVHRCTFYCGKPYTLACCSRLIESVNLRSYVECLYLCVQGGEQAVVPHC